MTFETIRAILVGYARVSTNEQTLDLQKDALEKIGCTKIGLDHGIGHLASMSSHQRLKRVSDLVILRHDDYRARD
jgi:DNA invertase Pin-like site-specific DNA recombinase